MQTDQRGIFYGEQKGGVGEGYKRPGQENSKPEPGNSQRFTLHAREVNAVRIFKAPQPFQF